ncbi:hypothetical protein BC835DRAFT_1358697 [Cytidiella melzeri]|nr:hypothetical protein BC835DRAFT_1358697 [Cytidiella melzeri]
MKMLSLSITTALLFVCSRAKKLLLYLIIPYCRYSTLTSPPVGTYLLRTSEPAEEGKECFHTWNSLLPSASQPVPPFF